MALWTVADLRARLSNEQTLQAFDDDNDGDAVAGDFLANIERVQIDSDSLVLGYMTGVYDVGLIAARVPPVPRLQTLSLDIAVCYCRQRWPSLFRGSWKELWDMAIQQLKDIRANTSGLGLEPGDPILPNAGNRGTEHWAGGDDTTVKNPLIFNGPGSMGDFSPS